MRGQSGIEMFARQGAGVGFLRGSYLAFGDSAAGHPAFAAVQFEKYRQVVHRARRTLIYRSLRIRQIDNGDKLRRGVRNGATGRHRPVRATRLDEPNLRGHHYLTRKRTEYGESKMAKDVLRAINQTRGTILCEFLEPAGGIAGQSRGLLGRDRLEPGHGMLFKRGRFEPFMLMHMFFMRFAIDIVFLDRGGRVIRVDSNLRPWRISSLVLRARSALEIEVGATARADTRIGDLIVVETAASTTRRDDG